MTDESLTGLEKLALQKAKTVSDQANIVLAANSFLFMPFVSSFTGARELTGLLVLVPIIICGVGIGLNAGLIWYIYKTKKSIKAYFATEDTQRLLTRTNFFTSLTDFFKKYASILLLITWCICISVVIVQLAWA